MHRETEECTAVTITLTIVAAPFPYKLMVSLAQLREQVERLTFPGSKPGPDRSLVISGPDSCCSTVCRSIAISVILSSPVGTLREWPGNEMPVCT